MAKNQTKSVVTPSGTFTFPHLFTPTEKEKFETGIVFTPGKDLSVLEELVAEAIENLTPPGVNKNALKTPLGRDGAEKEHLGGPFVEGAKFFTAKSKFKPQVVDGDNLAISDPSEVYPGCVGRLQIHAYYYDKDGNKGIAFGLDNVQKVADGERIDGRLPADQVFEKVSVDDIMA